MQTDNLIPTWLKKDNDKRLDNYKRDSESEFFLYSFNNILEAFEKEIETPNNEMFPFLYVVGVPRAGKTLFSQVLSHGLQVGYIDKIISKFWKAPCYGINLSKILRDREEALDYISDYGKTKGMYGPHDFSYFWHTWLKMNDVKYNPNEANKNIDWIGFSDELRRISASYDLPGVFKSPNPTYHIERISSVYKKTMWLHIERDYIDSAVSLLKGRRDNFGDVKEWYGQYPYPYEHLLNLPYAEQIVRQLNDLTKMYNKQFERIDPKQVVRVSYSSLCNSPKDTLQKIIKATEEFTGYSIRYNCDIPEKFDQSSHDKDSPDYLMFQQAFDKLNIPKRF